MLVVLWHMEVISNQKETSCLHVVRNRIRTRVSLQALTRQGTESRSALKPTEPPRGSGQNIEYDSPSLYNLHTVVMGLVLLWLYHHRADSRFAPSQWETALLCNDVSHWLGASLESALSSDFVDSCETFIILSRVALLAWENRLIAPVPTQ